MEGHQGRVFISLCGSRNYGVILKSTNVAVYFMKMRHSYICTLAGYFQFI